MRQLCPFMILLPDVETRFYFVISLPVPLGWKTTLYLEKFRKDKNYKSPKFIFCTSEWFRHTILGTNFFLSVIHEIRSTGEPISDFLVEEPFSKWTDSFLMRTHFDSSYEERYKYKRMEIEKRYFISQNYQYPVQFGSDQKFIRSFWNGFFTE